MWQQKRWHAPYYWAAFVLQGDYEGKLAAGSGRRSPNAWPAAVILALLAGAGVFFWKKKTLKRDMSINPELERQKKKWDLSQQSFESLLHWLDSDRDRAGKRYEDIRGRLIKIFGSRGCAEPDYLADETINRVAKRVDEIAKTYQGDPALYLYGVANKIHLEQLKKQKPLTTTLTVPALDDYEQEYVCLNRCIGHLPAGSRDLVLQYYEHEQHAKIVNRQLLAERLGIGLNALRIRAHRTRLALRECITSCLEKKQTGHITYSN